MAKRPPKPTDGEPNPRTKKKPTAPSRSLRQISEERLADGELEELAKEMRHTSDRGAALLVAPIIEQTLEQLIERSLPRKSNAALKALYERDGALSSLFSKIHLAYAMGLIDADIRDDMGVIRRVRNVFAHARRPVSFKTKEIADECRKMKTSKDENHPLYKQIQKILGDTGGRDGARSDREAFIFHGICIHRYLLSLNIERLNRTIAEMFKMAQQLKMPVHPDLIAQARAHGIETPTAQEDC